MKATLKTLLEEPYKLHVDGEQYDFGERQYTLCRHCVCGSSVRMRLSRSIGTIRRNCCTTPRKSAAMKLAAICGAPGFFQVRLHRESRKALMRLRSAGTGCAQLPPGEMLSIERETPKLSST